MAKSLISHRPGLAVTLKLSALFLFSIMSALVKAVSDTIPPGESVFFRSLFAIPVILVWRAARGEFPSGLRVKKISGHVWRGLLGTMAMGLNFAGLGLLPLPEVTAIGYATPIFTLILAALILGERIRLIRVSAVAIGLAGVVVMLWPRLGGDLGDAAALGAVLILAATIVRSFVQITLRQMVKTDTTSAIVFYFSASSTLLALPHLRRLREPQLLPIHHDSQRGADDHRDRTEEGNGRGRCVDQRERLRDVAEGGERATQEALQAERR